ncbi:hypothetical protein [Alienimonas californiensis]|uniref:Uncharacterized protein n=1 Tax=Alienimonas californiensis TaxID=2527989 RepID=A0A517PEN9_9PLAN|nr:hypothetical protein [Alienimonas californiensis]QDT17833.1 hypothetical protein CA12_39680 [Alienimonas californiensis]
MSSREFAVNVEPAPPADPAESAAVETVSGPPADFAALAASRREWVLTVLRPWCRAATRRDLRLAEGAWADLAGDVGTRETLWAWAWERFPALCEPGLAPPSESRAVRVTLTDGTTVAGTPDGRRSVRGELWLVGDGPSGWEERGPFALDQIARVEPADGPAAGPHPPPRSITMPH